MSWLMYCAESYKQQEQWGGVKSGLCINPTRLRECRKKAGLSQQQLADVTGADARTIARLERLGQETAAHFALVYALSVALGVSGHYLMGISGEKTPMVSLSAEEMALVELFRRLDDDGKTLVLGSVRASRKLMQELRGVGGMTLPGSDGMPRDG